MNFSVLSLIISVATLSITTWYYLNMLKLTQHLQQANTLSLIHSEYSSPKTLEAVEIIEDFLEEHGVENYAKQFVKLRMERNPTGRKVDRARRWLVHWFSRLQYFYEFGFLTYDYIVKFPGRDRANHFLQIIEPLEFISRSANGRTQSPVFDFLRNVYNLPNRDLSKYSFFTCIHNNLNENDENNNNSNESKDKGSNKNMEKEKVVIGKVEEEKVEGFSDFIFDAFNSTPSVKKKKNSTKQNADLSEKNKNDNLCEEAKKNSQTKYDEF